MGELKQLRVLYVEDDEATREALSRFIKPRVGKIFLAANGEEGLEKFKECKPHILIVDLIMPGISGLQMIREIRETNRDARVLITSTVSELNTIIEAVDLGIDHYIVKPIDTEDLEKKLEAVAKNITSLQKAKDKGFSFENVEKKGVIEENIRREFLKVMKIYMGKGPQDLKVLLYENTVEIMAIDAFSIMEKTILTSKKNISLVEQFRKLFYEEIEVKLEECVEIASGYPVKLSCVNVDGMKRMDKIILTVV